MVFTFAELLRSYRERASIDQRELATALCIHRNTLSRWECGQYLPRNRELVLRLVEELFLTPAEIDQFLHAAFCSAADGPVEPHPHTARHQLRPPVADFVGRKLETAQLVRALQDGVARGCGAVISGVQGMGGIGKTELAYQVAHQLRNVFPDAQIVLVLRGSSVTPLIPEQAMQTVIRTFAHEEKLPDDLRALQRLYRSVLHGQRALILADDACDARQVRPLIPPANSALLVTSRQRFTLPGMTIVDLDQLHEHEAVSLLCSICNRLSVADAQAIARACGHLPQALRVSGGMLRNNPAMSVGDYLQRLTDARQRLAQLRDPDDPQLDVEASLTLSYALLDAPAQHVFRQLGALVADFSTPLALAVVVVDAGVNVEAMLHLLLRRSLLLYNAARGRWRLHDLVRDLARHYLEAAGELEAVMWRYARAVVQLAQATQEQYLAGGENVLVALTRFDIERPHLDTAQAWAMAHAGTPAGDALLLAAVRAILEIAPLRYDLWHERIPQLQQALAAAQRLGDHCGEGQLRIKLGRAYVDGGETLQPLSYFEQGLAIVRAIGDRDGEREALNDMGAVYGALGKFRQAIVYLEQALTIAQATGNRRGEGGTLGNLGRAYRGLGEFERAIVCLEQALAVFQMLGARRDESLALVTLGSVYGALGDTARAIATYERALKIARAIGDRHWEGYFLSILGRTYAAVGDLAHAATTFETALAILQMVGDRAYESECSWHFSLVLVRQGERQRALALMRACVAYEQEIGHADAAEHATLLSHLEAGGGLPVETVRTAAADSAAGEMRESTSDRHD